MHRMSPENVRYIENTVLDMTKKVLVASETGSSQHDGPVAAARGVENDAKHVLDQVVLDYKEEATKRTLKTDEDAARALTRTRESRMEKEKRIENGRKPSRRTKIEEVICGRLENVVEWPPTFRTSALRHTLRMQQVPVQLSNVVRANSSASSSTCSLKAIIFRNSCQRLIFHRHFPKPLLQWIRCCFCLCQTPMCMPLRPPPTTPPPGSLLRP